MFIFVINCYLRPYSLLDWLHGLLRRLQNMCSTSQSRRQVPVDTSADAYTDVVQRHYRRKQSDVKKGKTDTRKQNIANQIICELMSLTSNLLVGIPCRTCKQKRQGYYYLPSVVVGRSCSTNLLCEHMCSPSVTRLSALRCCLWA